MTNSVDPVQTAPIGAVCSGSTLFASIHNSSVMLDNYLQQTTSADDIFKCIFSWRFKGKIMTSHLQQVLFFMSSPIHASSWGLTFKYRRIFQHEHVSMP